MKKYIAITALSLFIAVLSFTTGCSDGIITNKSGDFAQSSMSDLPSGNLENSSTEIFQSKPESYVPEIPKGEATFLICPDGAPVYTSEISKIYAGSEFDGNYETLTLEQAEQCARECEGHFNVECDGYAYGYIPKKALNRADDPKMFKECGDGEGFDFIGEEDELSDDCVRIKVGDKFGTLTVKSAETVFTDKWLYKEFSEEPGAYYCSGAVTFDGEVELTGYVDVWEDTDYQGAGGTMQFYPDGESSVKIPVILNGGISHRMGAMSVGYFGDWYCSLGNMSEVECDVSGLHKGDVFVKVKITAKNVSSGHGGVKLELKNLEVL